MDCPNRGRCEICASMVVTLIWLCLISADWLRTVATRGPMQPRQVTYASCQPRAKGYLARWRVGMLADLLLTPVALASRWGRPKPKQCHVTYGGLQVIPLSNGTIGWAIGQFLLINKNVGGQGGTEQHRRISLNHRAKYFVDI